jgi:hypothetical protein
MVTPPHTTGAPPPSHLLPFSFPPPFSQSAVVADGFRSLREGEPVEFSIDVADGDGRAKAADVTGPGGAAPQVREEGERKQKTKTRAFFDGIKKTTPTPPPPPFPFRAPAVPRPTSAPAPPP